MTQEDKKLLLIDLSARLPYRVMVHAKWSYRETNKELKYKEADRKLEINDMYAIWDIKPYLRPISSMADGELIEFLEIRGMNLNSEELKTFREGKPAIVSKLPSYSRHIDWLNAHHFDYRGLIQKGLALEAPEGIYKIEDYRTKEVENNQDNSNNISLDEEMLKAAICLIKGVNDDTCDGGFACNGIHKNDVINWLENMSLVIK